MLKRGEKNNAKPGRRKENFMRSEKGEKVMLENKMKKGEK